MSIDYQTLRERLVNKWGKHGVPVVAFDLALAAPDPQQSDADCLRAASDPEAAREFVDGLQRVAQIATDARKALAARDELLSRMADLLCTGATRQLRIDTALADWERMT